MLDVKPNINFDSVFLTKIWNGFKDWLVNLWFGMPVFLRWLTVIVICIGGLYFCYDKFVADAQLIQLSKDVKELKESYQSTVFYDKYIYDMQTMIICAEMMEDEICIQYDEYMNFINLFADYVQKTHPNEHNIINDLNLMKTRLEMSKETYDKHFQQYMKVYKLQTDSLHTTNN